MNWASFWSNNLVQIAVTILAALLLQLIARHTIERVVRRSIKRAKGETKLDERKREDTLINIILTTFAALIWLLTIGIVLTILGVNVNALLTGAGLIGVFAAFTAQSTVKDVLAGIFILTEEQYRVGDVITLSGGTVGGDGITGTVEQVTLRITKLRDLNGKLITVSNGEPQVVTNQTFSYASVLLDITVTYESDIAAVEKTINQVGSDLAKDAKLKEFISQPIKFQRIDSFGPTGVVVRAVGTVSPASQWEVAGEYRRRLLLDIAKQPAIHLAHS